MSNHGKLTIIRNTSGLAFIIISLACLYPGLTKALLSINVAATLPLLGKVDLYNQTQSIEASIRSLIESGNHLVAFLIFFFSVLVPVSKALLLLCCAALKNLPYRQPCHNFVKIIGKWSMADVFAVGVFMAFLGGQAHPNVDANLHEGFYYFTAYCLLSILGSQILDLPNNAPSQSEGETRMVNVSE